MSVDNAMSESQLRRRYNWSFPLLLISLGLITFFGADNLFGAVLVRRFYTVHQVLGLSVGYLMLFFWYVKPSVWTGWLLFWVMFAAIITGMTYYLIVVPWIAKVFATLMPVAMVLFIIVLIGVMHWYGYRDQSAAVKHRGRRTQMAMFCLFMSFYMQGLGLRDENDAMFVNSQSGTGRVYHFAVIPYAMDGPSLTLYECNQFNFACRKVYSEETRYDEEDSFSLDVDAGSLVILANGDPVFRHPLP